MIYETEGSPFRKFEQMDFTLSVWLEKWYPKICNILQINAEEDENALKEVLSITQSKMSSEDLAKSMSKEKKTVIFAPGVNLEDEFERNYPTILKEGSILVSADGATSYLVEQGIIPHFIVTDLDGNLEHQFKAQEAGSMLVIHVHGDNKNAIIENIEDFTRYDFLLTTQVEPLKGSYNFYGFTDGDRAVCLSTMMKAGEIILVGFDYGSAIGKYSKKFEITEDMKRRKMQKFVIAKSVINWCSYNGQQILV